MTDRKPALKRWKWVNRKEHYFDHVPDGNGKYVLASDLPPAILNATKEELAALAVFAEAMPGLLEAWDGEWDSSDLGSLIDRMTAALAAAEEECEP